jgi:dihydroflavonol-4-reductase
MDVVTGATGHIGNVLVRELLARGAQVRVLIAPGDDERPLCDLEVERVQGDIRNPASLNSVFAGAERVFHLAGIISIVPGHTQLLEEVNVGGTQNVTQVCLENGVDRLIYTSSIHALVEPPHGTIVTEESGFDPNRVVGDYARSKARASLAVLDAVNQGLDAVIVCPTGVIGPFDFKPSEMGQLILDYAQGHLQASTEGAYDFVDVRDVVAGLILAAQKGSKGEPYILSGEQISVHQIMRILQTLTGVNPPSLVVPAWAARLAARVNPWYCRLTNTRPRFTEDSIYLLSSNSRISSAKARRELGYTARPLSASIADSLRWFIDTGQLQLAA